MELLFNVQNQKMTRTDTNSIIGDSKNYLTARFTFSSDWAGKTKTAQFTKDKLTYDMLLVSDVCVVPWEVLQGSGIIRVNVFAGDLITVDGCTFPVQVSGLLAGQVPAAATPGIYQQILDGVSAERLAAVTAANLANTAASTANGAAVAANGAAGAATNAAGVATAAASDADTASQFLYLGADEPTDPDVKVWIDPDGTNSPAAEMDYADTANHLDGAVNVKEALDSAGNQLTGHTTQLAQKANVAMEAWIEPTLLNNWINISGTKTKYKKDSFGVVHVQLSVQNGDTGTSIFLLPVGYRPLQSAYFANRVSNTVGLMSIASNGNVFHLLGTTTSYNSLYCSFIAEA